MSVPPSYAGGSTRTTHARAVQLEDSSTGGSGHPSTVERVKTVPGLAPRWLLAYTVKLYLVPEGPRAWGGREGARSQGGMILVCGEGVVLRDVIVSAMDGGRPAWRLLSST